MSAFQPDPDVITWRMHFRSPPEAVYEVVASDEGRSRFWTEDSVRAGDIIHMVFPGGIETRTAVLDEEPPRLFRVEYFGATVDFDLKPSDDGGTDLQLTTRGFDPAERDELLAGWLNVLFPMKAWVDHGVDLRNHDPTRTWWQGYADG